ncbi:MAG: PEGA domain-containing protein [Treponema sp.]|nr:PEGA domain-containing protein [Treponema sp.]
MEKKFLMFIAIICFLSLFTSCVTSTRVYFDSNVEDAELYIDGKPYGTMPTQVKLSNLFWEDPDVILKKKGYEDYHGDLEKEPKIVNIISGFVFGWLPAYFWCYGPKKSQYYMMTQKKNVAEE